MPFGVQANDEQTKQTSVLQTSNQFLLSHYLDTALTAPSSKMCKEACWAQSASDRQLKTNMAELKSPKSSALQIATIKKAKECICSA